MTTPAARNVMLAAGTDGFAVFTELKRRDQSNSLRSQVLIDRLAERGKLSREQRGGAGIKMFTDPAFKAAYEESRVLLIAMMSKLELVT